MGNLYFLQSRIFKCRILCFRASIRRKDSKETYVHETRCNLMSSPNYMPLSNRNAQQNGQIIIDQNLWAIKEPLSVPRMTIKAKQLSWVFVILP